MSTKKIKKEDYSDRCNGDDENLNNPCWQCARFLFPIGCMIGEDLEEEDYE